MISEQSPLGQDVIRSARVSHNTTSRLVSTGEQAADMRCLELGSLLTLAPADGFNGFRTHDYEKMIRGDYLSLIHI